MTPSSVTRRSLILALLVASACDLGPDLDATTAAVERSPAVISFADDWSHALSGRLIAGGEVVVDYDLARLPQCAGDTTMGRRSWTTMAYVRFDAGAVATYDLVSCDDDACAAPVAAQPTISIPAGAASMEMWFATSGRSCGTHWDSNYGANYPFRVDSPAPLAASPTWIGNAIVHISRDPRDPCDGGSDAAHGFSFGTWARQRAAVHNACFDVWQPGVTDWDNPDLWRQLDVRVHYRFAAGAPFAWSYVSLDRRAGHNARYAWDVASLDPFGHRRCPQVPYTRGAHAVRARVDYFFSVNGAELRPSGADSLFSGEYVDYPTNPYRDHNCP